MMMFLIHVLYKYNIVSFTPTNPKPATDILGGISPPSMGITVLAAYEFHAKVPGQLSLNPGDVITNVMDVDDNWYSGVLNGVGGIFPKAFVESNTVSVGATATIGTAGIIGGGDDYKACVALYDFTGDPSAGTLSIKAGETLYCKDDGIEGWLCAKNNLGQEGIVPKNYIS